MRRIGFLAIGLVGIAVIGGWSWTHLTATPVDAARVRLGPITEYVDIEAKTHIDRTYKITMPIAGRVEAISLSPGDRVEQGQALAKLVSTDLENHVAELAATVERLSASIKEAEFAGVEEAEVDLSLKMADMMREFSEGRKSQAEARSTELSFANSHLARMLKARTFYQEEEVEFAKSERDAKEGEYQRDHHDHLASAKGISAVNVRAERYKKEIERNRLRAISLKFAREEAEARLRQARLDQQRSYMKSPIDGLVLDRFSVNERTLPAGAELLEVAKLDDMEVVAEVLTQDASRIRPGGKVVIYGPSLGDERVTGSVRRIDPRAYAKVSSLGVEEQRVNVIIAFEPGAAARLHNSYSVGVGFRVRVRIEVAQKDSVLIVPRFALFRAPDASWQLYTVRSGVAERTTVRVGLLNDEWAEIVEGLHDQDVVLTAPDSSTRASSHVRPVFSKESSASP